jgi:hypothetical protein
MIGDAPDIQKDFGRQVATALADLMAIHPNKNPVQLAEEVATTHDTAKNVVLRSFWQEYATSASTYRLRFKNKPAVQAAEDLARDIKKHKSLDLYLVLQDLTKKYKITIDDITIAFQKRYELSPYEYRRVEWDHFPNGGGNSARQQAKRRKEIEKNRSEYNPTTKRFGQRSPKFLQSSQSSNFSRNNMKTPQEEAWEKLMVMVNEVKDIRATV